MIKTDCSYLADVVVHMVNKGSYCEAIGVILSFELQDAFPLAYVLAYILDKVEDDRKFEGQCNLAGSVCLSFSRAIWRDCCVQKEVNCCVWFSGFSDGPGKFFPLLWIFR
jgi:hypothetical protein